MAQVNCTSEKAQMVSIAPASNTQTVQVHTTPQIRVLLVEDNDTSRQLMSDYLEYHGYQVCSLAGGTSVDVMMAQFQPHVILLDLKLPDVDGFTLLEQFQQRLDWQTVPVIVVSAFAFQADRRRALGLGARQYLVKPVNLVQLRRTIADEIRMLAVC
jgi:two-component system cell cycle response regulator DivK